MYRKLKTALICLVLALTTQAARADFSVELKKATDWDHTAQRNVAALLQDKNPIEACAWRTIVVFGRGLDVDDSDIINLEGCFDRGAFQEAASRAQTLAKTLHARPSRSVERDLADLTSGACSGSACAESVQRFAGIYKAAVRGETAATRALAECFEQADCAPAGFNGFQACLWTLETIRLVGDRDPRLRSRRATLCGSSVAAKAAVEHHLKDVAELRTSR